MAVKDLVGLYESRTGVTGTSQSSSSRSQERKTPQIDPSFPPHVSMSAQDGLSAPSPTTARFVAHPLLRRREPSSADQEDDPILPDPSVSSGSSATYVPLPSRDEEAPRQVADADVTDELLSVSGRHQSAFSRGGSRPQNTGWVDRAAEDDEDSAIELKALLPGTSGSSRSTSLPGSTKRRRDSLYEEDTASLASTSTVYKHPPLSSSTVTLVQPSRVLGPHTPIPLSKILARDAAPVSLPKLDEYISSLEMPTFPIIQTAVKGKGKRKKKGKHKACDDPVFPPLERLEGTTIHDLENNAKVAPAWRNRNTIFSSLSNIALGITVCSHRAVLLVSQVFLRPRLV